MNSTGAVTPPETKRTAQAEGSGVFTRLLSYIRFLAHRFLLRNAEWFVQWLMSYRGRDAVDGYRFDGGRRFFLTEAK